jgi:predicted NAD/FAD-dependent oxidoreductase
LGILGVTLKVAVIGAGLAGLSCARDLRRAGFFVEVFEQERVIGGRLSTARLGTDSFDYGAQYLTGRSAKFRNFLDEVSDLGYAARWTPRSQVSGPEGGGQMNSWIVGTPGMASIVRPLTESLRIQTSRRVHTLERVDKSWKIWFEDETSVGPFAAVAVCVPAPEARLLLGRVGDMTQIMGRVRMAPCWALMIQFDERVLPEQDVFSDMTETIRWIARNNTKPGRGGRGETIVIHASPSWSRQTEDVDPDAVADELWSEASHALGLPPVRPNRKSAYLWRHGLVEQSLGETFIYSHEHCVGAAGDWCLGRLAEHAFESGTGLAKSIINSLE